MSDLIERLLSCNDASESEQDRDCHAAGKEIERLTAEGELATGVINDLNDEHSALKLHYEVQAKRIKQLEIDTPKDCGDHKIERQAKRIKQLEGVIRLEIKLNGDSQWVNLRAALGDNNAHKSSS